VREVAADILDCDPARIEILPRFGDRDALIERLILGIGDVLHDDDPTATMYVDYLARAVAARLVQQHSSASSSTHRGDYPTTTSQGRLGKAIDFMEANLRVPSADRRARDAGDRRRKRSSTAYIRGCALGAMKGRSRDIANSPLAPRRSSKYLNFAIRRHSSARLAGLVTKCRA
jgi:hypothetical protein